MNLSKLRSLSVDAQLHSGTMNLPAAIRVLIARTRLVEGDTSPIDSEQDPK